MNNQHELNKNDFLTGEDLSGASPQVPQNPISNNERMGNTTTPPTRPQQAPTMQDTGVPDMETLDQIPNSAERQRINQHVDNTINTEDLIEEKIRRELSDIKKVPNPQHPKDILKNLIAKGEYVEDIELLGITWRLRALNQADLLLVFDEVKDTLESQTGRMTAVMFGQVVYALEAINGVPIYEWFPEITLESVGNNKTSWILAIKRALKAYLEALPPSIIDELHEKYLEIEGRRDKELESLKNS